MTLEDRVTTLEAQLFETQRILQLALYKLRETAIMQMSEIENLFGIGRTVPKREDRKKKKRPPAPK